MLSRNLTNLCGMFSLITALTGLPSSAVAAQWPEKPVRLIVPFAPGGNTDVVARLIAPELGKAIGQTVVVENKPGASGNIGADQVAKSEADGYTLLVGTIGTQAINPSVYKNIPYDTLKDFAPITLIATVPNVLVVNAAEPAKSVKELIANGKGKHMTFASSGPGSSIHLSGELFKSMAQLEMTHVPYRGSALALTDIVGGQVQMMFDNLPTSISLIQSGKLRALAVTSAERSPRLPDVPTMIESGYPGFEIGAWFGVLAPSGTPDSIIHKLNKAIYEIVDTPKFEEKLLSLGATKTLRDSEGFQAYIEAEYMKWAKVVEQAGASID